MELEELVRHYEIEQKRILDEIETERIEFRNKSLLDMVLGHPLLLGSAAWMASNIFNQSYKDNPNVSAGDKDSVSFFAPLDGDLIAMWLLAARDWKDGKADISTIAAGATGVAAGITLAAPFWYSQFYPNMNGPYWEPGFVLGGLTGLLTKADLSLRLENLENRKKITTAYKRNLTDILFFDLPTVALGGALAVGYKLFSSDTGHNVLEGDFSGNTTGGLAYSAVGMFLAGVTADIITQLASKYFDDSQRRRIFHKGKASMAALFGRNDVAIKSLESILDVPLIPSQLAKIHYDIGRQYLKLKDYGNALAEFDTGLKLSLPEKEFEWSQLSESSKGGFNELRESRNSEDLIRGGIIYYSKGQAQIADYCFARALWLNPENLFLHWIRADVLGMNERHEEEAFERNIFLNLMFSLNDLESRFTLQHDSRNKIAFYRDPEFPNFSTVMKMNEDAETINSEHCASMYFAEALHDRAIRPLDVREHNGLHYLIMPHAGTRLFEEVLRGNYSIADFREAIDILVDYFIAAENAVKKGIINVPDVVQADVYKTIDGREISNKDEGTLYFSNRIDDIALGYVEREFAVPNSIIKSFHDNSWVLNERLSALERVVSKDANLKNFYREPSGRLKAGDFESIKYVPVLCELSRLMEFGFEFLSDGEKEGLLEYFYGKWVEASENRKPTKKELEEFKHDYEFAALYDNLVLLGYRARDALRATTSEERNDDCREELFHLKSAGEHINNICGLEGILEEEKLALTALNQGIEALASVIKSKYQVKIMKTEPVKSRFVRTLAAAGLGILTLASATFFGRQLFNEEYEREAIGISYSILYPEQKEILNVIDTRTGEEIYRLDAFSSSFDWNPEKPQLIIVNQPVAESEINTFFIDLKSGEKIPINFGGDVSLPEWAPKGNYMLLHTYPKIVIFDKDGKRLDIKADFPKWAPDGRHLAYRSTTSDSLEISELKGNEIKSTYSGPKLPEGLFEYEFSPDSKKIAYVNMLEDRSILYVADSDFEDSEELLKSEHPISNLRWQDDVLYFEREGIYKTENGEIQTIISGKDVSFELSRDGNRILVNEYSMMYIRNLKTGEDASIDASPEGTITNALFTPDGKGIFYTVETGTGINAYLFSFEHGAKNLVLELCQNMSPSQQCIIEQIK